MKSKSILRTISICLILFLGACASLTDEPQALHHNSLGIQELDQRNYEEAIKHFTKAAEFTTATMSTRVVIQKNLSTAYLELADRGSAFYFAKEALKLAHKNTYDYYSSLGLVNLFDRNYDDAIKNYNKANGLNPDQHDALNNLGLIYMGVYDERYADYKKALLYNQKVFKLHKNETTSFMLGRNYIKLERYSEAVKLLEPLHDRTPNYMDYKYYLGLAKYKKGETKQAKKLLDELVARDSLYKELVEAIYL